MNEFRRKFLITGMTPNAGGIEAYIMNLVQNIDLEKVHFDFLVNFREPIAFECKLKEMGSRVYRLPGRWKHPLRHYLEYIKFFSKYARFYDGIYCNVLSLSNIDDLLFAKRYQVGMMIVHAHNSSDSGPDLFRLRDFLHNRHKRKIEKLAPILLSCSKQAGEWMFGESSKFQVINNAISTHKFKFSSERRRMIRDKLKIDSSVLVFGTVGRLEIQKNPQFLIEIFCRIKQTFPQAIFLHIGEGSLRPEMEEKINQYHLENSYLMMGSCEDPSDFYQAMDAFIFPSLYEGLGIALIEAQACGLPCFVSDTVPDEACIIRKQCMPLSLSRTADEWAAEIILQMSQQGIVRANSAELIARAGFDMESEICKIERIICAVP